jgi:tetratricopeptide (TPR) repeat protein
MFGRFFTLRYGTPLMACAGAWCLFVAGTAFGQGMSAPEVERQWDRAEDLARKGRSAEAASLYEQIMPSAENIYGKDGKGTVVILNNLALLYQDLGQYAKAESLYQRILRIPEAKRTKSHPKVALTLSNLAELYRRMGLYADAEPLLRRSLEMYEADVGKNHIDAVPAVTNLASLYRDMGQYGKAEPLYRRSLEIREARLERDHPKVALSLYNLARFYHYYMGEYAKAEPLYQRSLEIREAKLGKNHPDVAVSLLGLANLYTKLGQGVKAEPYFQRSLQILEAKGGPNHALVAVALNELAGLYDSMAQYAKAKPLYERSLKIYEANYGMSHPEVATACSNLAGLYNSMGKYAEAQPLFQRCLEINRAKLGEDHIYVARALHNLARNAASRQDWTTAVDYFQIARQGTANHLAVNLSNLSETEQLALLQANFERGFHRVLSLGWSAPAAASAPSAEWLLNGKAVAHQSLAEQTILARDAQDPGAKRLVESLQRTRARLAALVHILPKPGREAEYQKEIKVLKAAERDLAEKLARAVGRPSRANTWVGLNQLRAKLGPKTAFVDIARFSLFDFKHNKKAGLRYVAWITPPQGNRQVQLIDLGEANAIDQLVAQVRKALNDSPKTIKKMGEPEALEALQKPLHALSAKVLHPLLPTLENYEEWIVSPDGALWLTPWNALLLPKGQFAVEKYLIRHVLSGRDLVLELPKAKAESAYIFADPDYDLSPSKVMAAAGGLRGIGGSSLLGQRLRGAIGTWKVSFEFLSNEVVIRNEDNGEDAGKGTWTQENDSVTIQTKVAFFQGTIEANEIRGQRTVRNADGTTTRDTFRMERPGSAEFRSAGSALGLVPKVPRLPGTATEAVTVKPKIKKWLGQEPKVYREDQASEAMVKAVKNPRLLVLATHGYFLPTQDADHKDRPGFAMDDGQRSAALFDQHGQAIENPLLRCGLLFAGCNKRTEAKTGEDDGILTGLEIVGMNLSGCELVVLSACETGLGDVRSGEGVAGLRQAFQLAGAKGVLASLWNVPDAETGLLMSAFYDEIAHGRSQAAALRQAQLQRIDARRRQFDAAHPFFWAAFSLTSRGE